MSGRLWEEKRNVPCPFLRQNLSFFYSMSKSSEWCHLLGEFFHKQDKLPSNDKALKTKTIRQIKTFKNREKDKKLRKKERFLIWRTSEGCQHGQNRDQGRGQGKWWCGGTHYSQFLWTNGLIFQPNSSTKMLVAKKKIGFGVKTFRQLKIITYMHYTACYGLVFTWQFIVIKKFAT